MLTARVIPCLDVRDGRVVKGVRFQGLRDAGSPPELAAAYEAQGADELVMLDVSASPEGLKTAHETVQALRAQLSIPLTVGGGVRVADDAARLLDDGADKVSTNTAAVKDPSMLTEMATRFGMATTLGLVPFLMIGGWLIVAAIPLLAVLIGLQIARRAGNYAITRPGREMLFTLVDTETRYKAKPVIDIVVYRGGDMVTAWLHTTLREVLAFGLPGVALFAAGVAAVWTASGIYLGRKYNAALGDDGEDALTQEA